jgi:Flavodoxin domain
MKTIVVYESHYGNTAAVARAIAEGIGEGATALTTDEATDAAFEGVDLVVAGAPVMALRLPTDAVLSRMETDPKRAGADMSHRSMRDWLDLMPRGRGHGAAFETKLRWSPGGATSAIEKGLEAAGYPRVAKSHKFVVTGGEGPLRDGELEAAGAWGAELRRTVGSLIRAGV